MTTRRRRRIKKNGKNGRKQKGKMVRVDFMNQRIVPRWPLGGFPDKFTAKLRYVQEFGLDTGAGLNSVKTFRANGIFDPDFAVGGHQPMFSDEIYNIYNTSVVMGSKATLRWIPDDSTNVIPSLIIAYKNKLDKTLQLFDIETILEQINRRGMLFAGIINSNVLGTSTQLTITYSPQKDLGIKDPVDDDLLRGTAAAGPSTEFFFEVYSMSIAGNNPGVVRFIIEIDYLTEFFDRKRNSGS